MTTGFIGMSCGLSAEMIAPNHHFTFKADGLANPMTCFHFLIYLLHFGHANGFLVLACHVWPHWGLGQVIFIWIESIFLLPFLGSFLSVGIFQPFPIRPSLFGLI